MKFQRITPRSMMILAGMLFGYGLVTVCLILMGYLTSGSDLAMLIAAGATSIAVPITGLLALLASSWQQAETQHKTDGDGPDDAKNEYVATTTAKAPLIDRSIVLIGNGYEHLSMEASPDALRIGTGIHPDAHRPSADVPDGDRQAVHDVNGSTG